MDTAAVEPNGTPPVECHNCGTLNNVTIRYLCRGCMVALPCSHDGCEQPVSERGFCVHHFKPPMRAFHRVRIAIALLIGLALMVGFFGLLALTLALWDSTPQWDPSDVLFAVVWLVALFGIPIGTIYALGRWVRKAR